MLDGIELVDDITNVRTNEEDKPINKIIINSIRFVNAYEKVNSLNYEIYEKNERTLYKIEDKVYKEVDKETNLVKIEVKNYGIMIAELYPKTTPKTVKNFKKLVSEKFYDNLTFHRVIKDFMIQTGDPLGNGTGGSDENIKGEFSLNGVKNDLSHKRGILSMARQGSNPDTEETMNSATSQFFIVHADSDFLDGNYAAFGKLLYGYDVLDKVANIQTNEDDKPITPQRLLTIRFVEEGE